MNGQLVKITGAAACQFWLQGGRVAWDNAEALYREARTGRAIPDVVVKAGDETVVANARRELQRLSLALQAQTFDLDDWVAGTQNALKREVIAQLGLAHGGFDAIPTRALRRGEVRLFEQFNGTAGWTPGTSEVGEFPGLRRFAEDIQHGRYGLGHLADSALSRALSYAESGRALYENEVLSARREAGHDEACAILGMADHCKECVQRASLGWVSIEEMLRNYPIGASRCGARCHCTLRTRRGGQDDKSGVFVLHRGLAYLRDPQRVVSIEEALVKGLRDDSITSEEIRLSVQQLRNAGYDVEYILRQQELTLQKSVRENVVVLDKDGRFVLFKEGQADFVRLTDAEWKQTKGRILTHNHPGGWMYPANDPRSQGVSFSDDDIREAAMNGLAEIRIITPTARYSMKPPKEGWNAEYWFDKIEPSFNKHRKLVFDRLLKRIELGKISPEEAGVRSWHLVWQEVAAELKLQYKETRIK